MTGSRRSAPARPPSARSAQPSRPSRSATAITLDNGRLRVVIDDRGLITSLIDLASGRDVIPAGRAGNLLQVHRDIPNEWDAWDIDEHYRRHSRRPRRGAVDHARRRTPDLAVVAVGRAFGGSTVEQQISLARGARPASRSRTTVDWHERQKLLKLAFPLDVQADRSAAETQFGHVFRPTHTNTSWDAARFEICAHRWIHVAEPGFGVAIANDRTYGHDVTVNRGPGGGGRTDHHRPAVAAAGAAVPGSGRRSGRARLPHVGDAGGRHRRGGPGRVRDQPAGPRRAGSRDVAPIVTVSNPAVVVEAVKLAEDRSGDVDRPAVRVTRRPVERDRHRGFRRRRA